MINKLPLFAALLLLGLNLSRLPAQPPADPSSSALEVIATNGADKEKHLPSINGIVPTVMVRPDQIVPVTLQFPAAAAGTPVSAVALDGGHIDAGDLLVLPTGKAMFTFRPGAAPGRYRVEVRTPGERHLLEFCVVDPNRPPLQQRATSSR